MKENLGRPRKYNEDMRKAIAYDYVNTSMSRAEVAKKYGVSTATVDACRREYGDKRQAAGGAG